MANRERSGERDLTISAWHRQALQPYLTKSENDRMSAIDLDLMGLCQRCNSHLYVIEATRDDIKATSITEDTARRLNCLGYLVQYKITPDDMRVTQVWPPRRPGVIGGRAEFERIILHIRDSHEWVSHGRRLTRIEVAG